jgi:hypothetical protein
MEHILNDEEFLANGMDGNIPETPVMIQEPETTEAVPAIEPNTVNIPETPDVPVIPDLNPPMQDIPVQGEPVPKTTDIPTSCPNCDVETMTYGQYFGTLMESIQIAWRFHLQAKNNNEHIFLNEYYEDAKDLIDSFIEEYQGRYGVISEYSNCVCDCGKTPITYFTELRTFVEKGKQLTYIMTASELMSDLDAVVSKIDSTLYKLTNLTETKNRFKTFEEFVNENKQ